MFGKYKIALVNPGKFPFLRGTKIRILAPLKRGFGGLPPMMI
jgi:hypothetical protein